MVAEIRDLKLMNVDEVVMLRYEVFDLNGSTTFTISSGTYELKRRHVGDTIIEGALTVNNNDVDRAGNAIKTVSMTLDMRQTDADTGHYFLILYVQLSTGQTKYFRVPCKVVDLRGID